MFGWTQPWLANYGYKESLKRTSTAAETSNADVGRKVHYLTNLSLKFDLILIKNVADPYKDMAKWVTNLVEMKIASCWLPRKPVLMDIESILKRKLDGLNLDGLNLDDLDLDSLNVELLKCNETEDWSVIGYIEEHKGKPYDLEQLYDTIFEIAMWNRMISHQAYSDFWCLSLK